jgi:hypothetical protein
METEVQALEWEVQNTKDSIAQNIHAIKDVVTDKKKQIADKLNLKAQMDKHPLEFAGGAVILGVLVGAGLGSGKALKAGGSFLARFHPEFNAVRGMVLGTLFTKVGDLLGENFPEWSSQIKDVCQSATSKLASRSRDIPQTAEV